MSQLELLKGVLSVLDEEGVEYMITGSFASSFYGEPRTTHDLDLVVQMESRHVPALRQSFPSPEFYLDEDAARKAIRESGMFNLISTLEGDKVDFWMLTDSAWDRTRFRRRTTENVLGMGLMMPTPDDVILAKLSWSKLAGGSEKQIADAVRVYEVQGDSLDNAYIERWAAELDVSEGWKRVQLEAESL